MDDFATGFIAGQDNGGNGNGGFWGGEGLWAVIILAIIFGWGRNGLGGFGGGGDGGGGLYVNAGGNCHCATPADIQRGFDNQSVINKLNGLENGLASLGYDQLGQMNGINANLAAGFAGVNNAICTLGYQNAQLINGVNTSIMQQTNTITAGQTALSSQLASCCCDAQYRDATNTNALMQSAHADTDRIIARIDQMESARQAEKIEALRAENQSLRFAASQAAQNCYLVDAITDRVAPTPRPSYSVPAPYPYSQQANRCCGCA